MRVVFMGTPEFAVPCLQALLAHGDEVVGVYTQPDKPKGRGHRVLPPPVKQLAMEASIPVFQPKTLRDEAVQAELKALAPDLIIVVAYGKLLPKAVLDIPPLGCINVHASLLPRYRGAGPIQWSVLNGETETGVTTMYMAEGLDTGDMIFKASTPIGENETADELHDRLSALGAETLARTLDALANGNVPREVQEDAQSNYAPMLTRELCGIDFSRPAQLVHNQIRGLSSWPCATTTLEGKRLKVYRSELATGKGKPGTVLDERQLLVACGEESAILLTEVQAEGSKRMAAMDYLRGHPIKAGTVLGKEEV